MSDSIIADSSGLISLLFPADANNKKAIEISNIIFKENKSIFIPSDVFGETINVIGKKMGHAIAYVFGEKILTDTNFTITEIPLYVRTEALEMLKKQRGSVSYTDCVVMAIADHFETKYIFGFDKVFFDSGYKLPG